MQASRLGVFAAALFLVGTIGCSTTAGRCEDTCEHLDNCGFDPAPNCADKCEDDYDDAGDSCQDSFDDWADCLSDHDLECTNACDSAAVKAGLDCNGQFGS